MLNLIKYSVCLIIIMACAVHGTNVIAFNMTTWSETCFYPNRQHTEEPWVITFQVYAGINGNETYTEISHPSMNPAVCLSSPNATMTFVHVSRVKPAFTGRLNFTKQQWYMPSFNLTLDNPDKEKWVCNSYPSRICVAKDKNGDPDRIEIAIEQMDIFRSGCTEPDKNVTLCSNARPLGDLENVGKMWTISSPLRFYSTD